MIRAYVHIQNYNPQDGYHYMQVTRMSDGEIIKDTEIFPKFAGGTDDNLWNTQILHYVEPYDTDENLIGDYTLRIILNTVLVNPSQHFLLLNQVYQ